MNLTLGTAADYLTSPVLNFLISKMETVVGTKLLHMRMYMQNARTE